MEGPVPYGDCKGNIDRVRAGLWAQCGWKHSRHAQGDRQGGGPGHEVREVTRSHFMSALADIRKTLPLLGVGVTGGL